LYPHKGATVQSLEEEEKKDGPQVSLHYDAQWLSILQTTQELMPLTDAKHDFRNLSQSDAKLMERIHAE